jgi:hypothetical protein
MEWFPMAYMVVKKGQNFNWESILSFSIVNCDKDPKGIKNLGFFMSSYPIDEICSTYSFPTFSWAWTIDQSRIYLYCSQLWEVNYKEHFYEICDYFLSPLPKAIFGIFLHRISPDVIKALRGIGD